MVAYWLSVAGVTAAVVAATAWTLTSVREARRRGDRVRAWEVASDGSLVVALVAVAAVTLVAFDRPVAGLEVAERTNLVPFRSILLFVREADTLGGAAVSNLVGNLLLFVPAGAALGLHPWRPWRRAAAIGLLVTLSVELFQLPLGRSADVDDVLLNGIGGLTALLATRRLTARWRPDPPAR